MNLDAIELLHQRRRDDEESLLVQLTSGDHVGWGEATLPASPRGGAEWGAAAFLAARDWLAPAILGRWAGQGDELQALLKPFVGCTAAKCALDMAWWNLKATQQAVPLWKLLGGTPRPLEAVATLGPLPSVDQAGVDAALALIDQAAQRGVNCLRLSIRPGRDLTILRAVRAVFPQLEFIIECGGQYTLEDHFDFLCRMGDFSPRALEQPFADDDLWQHARLQESAHVPLAIAARSPQHVVQVGEFQSAALVVVDPGRLGGLTPALRVLEKCQEYGLGAYLASSTGSGLHGCGLLAEASAALAMRAELWPMCPLLAAENGIEGLGGSLSLEAKPSEPLMIGLNPTSLPRKLLPRDHSADDWLAQAKFPE